MNSNFFGDASIVGIVRIVILTGQQSGSSPADQDLIGSVPIGWAPIVNFVENAALGVATPIGKIVVNANGSVTATVQADPAAVQLDLTLTVTLGKISTL